MTAMTRKAWLEYLQKAVDEFDWDAAYKEEPQRQWVGLTDEEKITLAKHFRAADIDVFDMMEETEAKLKEKNS